MTTTIRSHIVVRSAVAADAYRLAALSIQVWLSTYATEGVSDRLARYVLSQFSPPNFIELAKASDASLLVAEVEANLIGYSLVRFGAAQNLVPTSSSELCTLYVQEAFTRAGVGSVLLQKARAVTRERTGSDDLWLSVNVKNRRACDFYGKHGFVVRGSTLFILGDDSHENFVLAPACA